LRTLDFAFPPGGAGVGGAPPCVGWLMQPTNVTFVRPPVLGSWVTRWCADTWQTVTKPYVSDGLGLSSIEKQIPQVEHFKVRKTREAWETVAVVRLEGRSSRQGKHLPFSCVITVTKLNLVRPFGLRSSEAQIPQIVVNVRNLATNDGDLGAVWPENWILLKLRCWPGWSGGRACR
jgi:hypothetical protein